MSAVAALGARDVAVDFSGFVDEIARELTASVATWRVRIGEAAAHWSAAGMDVRVLERALRLATPPDVDALLATYDSAAARCQALAAAVAESDAALARHPAFSDPARLAEAEVLAARAASSAASPASIVDPESWVVEWPYVADFLIDEWS